jgi:monofunctional biosynthetic peptidoglycan transglycosylase
MVSQGTQKDLLFYCDPCVSLAHFAIVLQHLISSSILQQMKNGSLWQRIWKWTKRIFLILFISQFIYIIILKWVNPPITITQLQSWITGNGLKRDYVDYDEMSYNIKLAVIASEDQIFPDHDGFDWKSIQKAMKYNQRKPGRRHGVKGASTISQQVAKNVFLWQGRDWIRKGLEMYFTKMIEWIWGKRRIMEMYLNVIEMGKGVFGVEAASRAYFGKPAKNLVRREAAMIAASLPNPKVYKVKPPSGYVMVKSGWIVRQMNNLEPDPDVQRIIK